MTPERWRQVEELYHSARESGRGVLADVDPDLRREVERLLAQKSDGAILDGLAAELLEDSGVSELSPGAQLGPYRIEARLGAGGMGQVFRAVDVRLGRAVAIKTCREQFSERFHREARAISSLNHPHICTLYDIGPDYLVMELVEGETLAKCLRRGRLSVDQTIENGIQIADALSAAHAKGIVHRDLKPGNIMLTESGVKVLDFGVAKLAQDEPLTMSRVVMGTPAYMSPEQRAGEECDSRSDIYAFGLVLYEMASGRRFTSTAPLSGDIPADLQRIVSKCLESDRDLRYQHASEVRTDLQRLKRDTDSARVAATLKVRSASLPMLIVAGAAAGCVALLTYLVVHPVPPPRVSGYIQITNDGRGKGVGATGTDGSRLYFGERWGMAGAIAQISTAGGETALLQEAPVGEPEVLDISPSRSELLVSNYMGFGQEFGWPLWVLPVPAGAAHRIGNLLATCAAWSPDGREIAFVKDRDLYRAKRDGSEARKLATLPGPARWLRWSPDGSRLRMTLGNPLTRSTLSMWEVSADGKRMREFLRGWNQPPTACCGNWTPDGKYFVFQAARNGKTEIWATRERAGLLGKLQKGGEQPVQVTSGQLNSTLPVLSPDGKSLYVIGEQLRGELTRYDAKSREWKEYLSGVSAEFVNFSRDGQWVAYITVPEGVLWRSRTDGSDRLQLTLPPMRTLAPCWSPDGKSIAFSGAIAGGFWTNYVISPDGGTAEPLWPERHNQVRPSWSPDGNAIVFSYAPGPETANGIVVLNLATKRALKLAGSEGLLNSEWSPDGRYIAARTSDHQAILLFNLRTQKWTELVRRELNWFHWSRAGRGIYFEEHGVHNAVMRVSVDDHKVEDVVSLQDVRRTGAGFWFGLAPDDSPIVLRDTGTQEIYALDWQEH